jgi:RimJ/RimL family protein N-acetyltransferase
VVTFLRRASLAHPDIGFALLPAFENQGYAFEAVSGYLHKIRQSNQYENVLGITMPTNVKSIRLLTKLGLHFHHDFEQNGETLALYSLEAAHQ